MYGVVQSINTDASALAPILTAENSPILQPPPVETLGAKLEKLAIVES
jgi:hypothetical protein